MIEPSTIEAGGPTPAHVGSHIDPPAITVDRAVWAKVKGFPWWPARVQKVSGQTITVFFFGTEQLGKVRAGPSSCVPFSARPAGAVVAAGKRGISGHDSFVEAVAQAQAYDVRAGLSLTRGGSGHVEVVTVEWARRQAERRRRRRRALRASGGSGRRARSRARAARSRRRRRRVRRR